MIIGLAGYSESGKSAIADYLAESDCDTFRTAAFADALKNILAASMTANELEVLGRKGWDEHKKEPEVRDRLISTGSVIRAIDEDFFVRAMAHRISGNHPEEHLVISDVRFPNEARFVFNSGGVVVRVLRPGVGPKRNHPSETWMDQFSLPIVHNDRSIEDAAEDLMTTVAKISEIERQMLMDQFDRRKEQR